MLERLSATMPLHEQTERWGALLLRRRFYVTSEAPPLELTTSARAIVFRDRQVVVVDDAAGHKHVWPGGRCEAGESLEQTVRRELLEETGWSLADLRPFGIVHFRHLNARPPDYRYPYPDFLQAIYLARGDSYDPAAIVRDDGWEKGSDIVDIDEALRVVDEDQRVILRAALDALRRA